MSPLGGWPARALLVVVLLGGVFVPRPEARAVEPAEPELVEVLAPSRDDVHALVAGFDLAESRRGDWYRVVAWPGDRARLEDLGLAVRSVRTLSAPKGGSGSPYRHLADYERDLRDLATAYPGHVRLLTGVEPSLEGRPILGVEIAGHIERDDGRPVAYIDGIHHAREWPAGEVPMNFAIELASGYGVRPGITRLLDNARVIIVPVLNVDGFHHSRQSLYGDQVPLVFGIAAGGQGTYWRKNMRAAVNGPGVSVGAYGVDNNRNYSFLWGSTDPGPNATTSPLIPTQTYHGAQPFSEPETRVAQNIMLTNNVVAMISNHTHGGLVLHPWGHTFAPPPDDGIVELARAMAEVNGYRAQPGIDLYPTTGTADDWAYATLGAYAYTFEMMNDFHPPEGLGNEDKLNRNAYKVLLAWAADPAHHSVLEGSVTDASGAPIAASLRLTKSVTTPLNEPYNTILGPFIETIDLSMTAAADGSFSWHVNPSGRPLSSDERYTMTVSAPGFVDRSLSVSVERGDVASLGAIVLDAV
jgi:hypothetical protein